MAQLSKNERQQLLAEFVLNAGTARVEDILKLVDASPMTIYRDLSELEEDRVIVRSRGEVSAVATSLSETSMKYRLTQEEDEKASLATQFASLITRGTSLLFDDSSTVYSVLKAYTHIGGLTIITNNWSIIALAGSVPDWELITLGGRYDRHLDANYGPAGIEMLKRVRADHAIISAAAVNDGVVYHPYDAVAEYKSLMIAAASQSHLAVTHSKFERTALHRVADTADFDDVVVDSGTSDEIVQSMLDRGATVKVGPPVSASR
ncbi:DeoR/GlpR transcriptional regulator [Flaviflexus salsibiostraticola]|uniref:Lactose phosphotransferase system repressor n=1 Tax=Flaviflexus salsibiostraticola TaxID=1282737 RepID=A0A3S8Z978_9ACTO|nr:DeoR/GlpR family DNA-binding transcription regulator [Flaviflexus salsibiostraticola]AZN30004.1 DeoR/GlpR transcriptional regulator [Flaviflexus salsibiostraticola]